MSDDYSNTYTGATSLVYGKSALGLIEAAWDVDYFKLTALQAGNTYTLELYPGSIAGLAPTKALLGTISQLSTFASGESGLVQITSMTASEHRLERFNFTPTTSGDYYLAIQALYDSTASYAITYGLADLTPPAAPTLTSNIGTVANHLSLKGSAEANSTVVIYADGASYRSAIADANGNWTYDEAVSYFASGNHQLTAQAMDQAGNKSAFSNAVTVTLDTVAPAAPTWKEGLWGATFKTSTPTLNGRAEAGSRITVLSGTTIIGSATAGADGTWSATVNKLADGAYTLKALAKDTAGNESVYNYVDINVATQVPAAPIVALAREYVTAPFLWLEGKAAPSATVTVTENGNQLFKTTALANGTWSGAVFDLTEGGHTWQVTATNSIGNTSPATELKFKVDSIPPEIPTLNTVTNANGVIDSNQPLLSGRAEALATVRVLTPGIDANNQLAPWVVASTTAGSDGTWQVRTELLSNGWHSIMVSATDTAGNQSLFYQTQLNVQSAQNITGASGADRITVTPGNHVIDGGADIDTASFAFARAGAQISINTEGRYVVTSTTDVGTQLLLNVERLQFNDKSVALDIGAGAHGGMVYRLYQAAFDRTPDAAGVGYWLKQVDNGTSMRDVADGFLHSAEFANLMGSANPDNGQFLGKLYSNILHRAPDQAGYDYWLGVLDKGADRAEVLAGFSEGAENQAQVIGSIKTGFDYIPFTG